VRGRVTGAFHRVADPFRQPVDALRSILQEHPIGSVYDKILIGVLSLQLLVDSIEELYQRPDVSIGDRLGKDVLFGTAFSPAMVDRFFRPFLGGIFFDNKLRTNAHELDFVFRMLSLGENCLPKKGIHAVSDYMASLLPTGSLRLNTEVVSIAKDCSLVKLANGETLKAAAVVVATNGPSVRSLLSGVSDLGPQVCVCVRIYSYVYKYTYTYVCVCVCVHIRIHTHTQTHTHTHAPKYVYIHVYTHTHTHTHTYVYLHTLTHTRPRAR
jgi:hypothetical protein